MHENGLKKRKRQLRGFSSPKRPGLDSLQKAYANEEKALDFVQEKDGFKPKGSEEDGIKMMVVFYIDQLIFLASFVS